MTTTRWSRTLTLTLTLALTLTLTLTRWSRRSCRLPHSSPSYASSCACRTWCSRMVKCHLGSARARLLCLLSARLAAPGGSRPRDPGLEAGPSHCLRRSSQPPPKVADSAISDPAGAATCRGDLWWVVQTRHAHGAAADYRRRRDTERLQGDGRGPARDDGGRADHGGPHPGGRRGRGHHLMSETRWLGLRPAGSPEAAFNASSRLGLPQSGQPRPISRLGRACRPCRACFRPRHHHEDAQGGPSPLDPLRTRSDGREQRRRQVSNQYENRALTGTGV